MQNMSVFLTGRIKETAIDSFVKYLRYDEKIISKNAGKSFFPQRSGLYSNWLVDAGGMLTHCRYYPSEVQLGIVANNMEEQAARSRVLKRFPGQRLRATSSFRVSMRKRLEMVNQWRTSNEKEILVYTSDLHRRCCTCAYLCDRQRRYSGRDGSSN